MNMCMQANPIEAFRINQSQEKDVVVSWTHDE